MQSVFQEMAATFHPRKPFRLVPGGKERQDSVWNGLQALSLSAQVVAIQDGARPCTTEELIGATIEAARATGAGCRAACCRHHEGVRRRQTHHPSPRPRPTLGRPNTASFRVEVIRRALAAARQQGLHVTDDTAACELIGQPVRLVPSARPNRR